MNDNMIHELVENSIKNSDRDQFNQVVSFSNPREEYIYNSAKRLRFLYKGIIINHNKKRANLH